MQVKILDTFCPDKGSHPRKLLSAFGGGGLGLVFVIDTFYKRGTTPWFFRGPGGVIHAGDSMSLQHCGHSPFAGANPLRMTIGIEPEIIN